MVVGHSVWSGPESLRNLLAAHDEVELEVAGAGAGYGAQLERAAVEGVGRVPRLAREEQLRREGGASGRAHLHVDVAGPVGVGAEQAPSPVRARGGRGVRAARAGSSFGRSSPFDSNADAPTVASGVPVC